MRAGTLVRVGLSRLGQQVTDVSNSDPDTAQLRGPGHTFEPMGAGQTCSALANLAAESANLAAMGNQRVFGEVLAAMRTHRRHAELQWNACGYAHRVCVFLLGSR